MSHAQPGAETVHPTRRALLVFQLLLGALPAPTPNFAQLLLGFDVEDGPEGACELTRRLRRWPSTARRCRRLITWLHSHFQRRTLWMASRAVMSAGSAVYGVHYFKPIAHPVTIT